MLKVSKNFPCSEGTELEMLKTYSINTTLLKRRKGSGKYSISVSTLADSSLSKRRVGLAEDRIGTTTSSTIGWKSCEKTWSRETSPLERRVGLTKYYIDPTTSSTNGCIGF
jgi:hypothetical protein